MGFLMMASQVKEEKKQGQEVGEEEGKNTY